MSVTVFTMNHCPYCERAKSLLKQRDIPFTEVKVADDDEPQWDALFKKTGLRTMPQIIARDLTGKDRVIGGYTDLAALDSKDQLASLK